MPGFWVKTLPRAGGASAGATSIYDWEEEAEAARSSPGEWRCVAEQVSPSHAMAIKEGKKKAFRPPDHWMVATRNGSRQGQRLCDIYVAFVGVPGAREKARRVPGVGNLR